MPQKITEIDLLFDKVLDSFCAAKKLYKEKGACAEVHATIAQTQQQAQRLFMLVNQRLSYDDEEDDD